VEIRGTTSPILLNHVESVENRGGLRVLAKEDFWEGVRESGSSEKTGGWGGIKMYAPGPMILIPLPFHADIVTREGM